MSMEIPTIAPETIVALLIGLAVDYDFAMRRIRGYGRYWLAKLPQYEESPTDTPTRTDTARPEDGR
ncbi:hypothetical protein [Halorussus litoreus]|uniref:hypothetical protein n=1 Tax=Halorussus litoreus TaxID=1710536 RepID=UPI0013008199|nr:hypothetical protein [Halorussus litoreus]